MNCNYHKITGFHKSLPVAITILLLIFSLTG